MLTGTFHGLWTAFVWGSLVRIFVLHHMTWSINSICHFYGRRPYDTDEESRNVWPFSILSFASRGTTTTTHSRALPSSASSGGRSISAATRSETLKWLGLVRDVRRPTDEQRKAKRLR